MGDSAAEGESSNLAEKSVPDVSVTKKRKPEEDTQKSEMNNGDAKKLKTTTVVTNGNNSVTEEVSENETGVSGREAEEKEETPGWRRLAIILGGFPNDKMTEEQAEVVETAIVEKINPTDKGEPIQFSATQYENGGLVVTCVNRATKAWLRSTVPKIVPWPGAKLAVAKADTTLKGCKFILWVMMGMNKRKNQQILDFFQKQNKDISTAEWKIIRRVSESDKKERLTLWVDDKSLEDLKSHNFKLFLGLARPKFMPLSEWKKQMVGYSVTKQQDLWPADRNLARPPASNSFSRSLVPGSGLRAMRQFRGRGLSRPNPRPFISRYERQDQQLRRELEFDNMDSPQFRETQFSASGRRGRVYTESAVLQNRESRFLASEQHRERGFGMSDRPLHREPVYNSDEPQENRFFASDSRQPRERGYGASDRPRLRETRFPVSDQLSPREMRYAASDHTLSRDSRYMASNRDQSENPRFRDSYQPPSRDSRFRDLNESRFQESRFRGSDQMQSREGRFEERETLISRKSRSRLSDPQQFREFDNTVSRVPRSWEDMFSGSDFPPQQSRSSYTNSTHSRFSRPSGSNRANW